MRVKVKSRKVVNTNATVSQLKLSGSSINTNPAIKNPTATAFIPEREFFILDIFFKSFQKGTKNSTRINPGRLIPKVATTLPNIWPPIDPPACFIVIAPTNEVNEKVGPGSAC